MRPYSGKWDYDYSGIPTNLPQCKSRLYIKESQRQFRVETSSQIFYISLMKGTPIICI